MLDMRLLITFAISFEPDQDRQNIGPDLDPIKPSDTLIVFLKGFFENIYLKKSQQTTTKAWTITQHAKACCSCIEV